MRVPMRVMRPLRFSERTEVSTSVEPFSEGASRAAHSSRPALSDCSVSRSCTSSHSSSRACDAACSSARRASSMGGHTAVDMVMCFQGTTVQVVVGCCPGSMAKLHNSPSRSSLLSEEGSHPCIPHPSHHVMPHTSDTCRLINLHRHDPSHPPTCFQASRGLFGVSTSLGMMQSARDSVVTLCDDEASRRRQ